MTTAVSIVEIGDPLPRTPTASTAPHVAGAIAVSRRRRRHRDDLGTRRPSSETALEQGLRPRDSGNEHQPFTIAYLHVERTCGRGEHTIRSASAKDGSEDRRAASRRREGASCPTTVWRESVSRCRDLRDTSAAGIAPGPAFPVPEVALRGRGHASASSLSDKPDAVVLDFFAGSGTTAHAVARLNRRTVAVGSRSWSRTTRCRPKRRSSSAARPPAWRSRVGGARHLRAHHATPDDGSDHRPDTRWRADQGRLQVHRRVPDGRRLRGERRVPRA